MRRPQWWAKFTYIKHFDKSPVNEKAVLLESHWGKKIDGNIYYIAKELNNNPLYADYEIYLSANRGNYKKIKSFVKSKNLTNINVLHYESRKYFKILATAKYLFNDVTFAFYFMKKPGQIYLNTWHGTPLKTLGKKMPGAIAYANTQKNFITCDYILAPNEYTANIFVEDYMLENVSKATLLYSGYPRNDVFFDREFQKSVREKLGISSTKKIYAYMPTWRGTTFRSKGVKNTNLYELLKEIESKLADDEEFYINVHPYAKNDLNIKEFTKIKFFPSAYETYEFLSACDVLITDYSSVMFDYACTKKQIVLFTFDKADYLEERNIYFDMDELPFAQVTTTDELFEELRSGVCRDYTAFLQKFCPYDSLESTKKLLAHLFASTQHAPDDSRDAENSHVAASSTSVSSSITLRTEKIPDNGKPNVYLYSGNLSKNGITSALVNLLSNVNLEEKNYIVTFMANKIKGNEESLNRFPPQVKFVACNEKYNHTFFELFCKVIFREKLIKAATLMKVYKKRFAQGLLSLYGGARIDNMVNYVGYEQFVMLMHSALSCKKEIYVHNNMIKEIETRNNQRYDVLEYCYNHYDKVASVGPDIKSATVTIKGNSNNIYLAKNLINYKDVLAKSQLDVDISKADYASVTSERLNEILDSKSHKFISIGRFSKEKGHLRLIEAFNKVLQKNPDSYLIIMAGNSLRNYRNVVVKKVKELALEERVILLQGISNPYSILKKCDSFVLSSFYEGMGLVLAEADILGKPVVSTDVDGPHSFLLENGGCLVEDSEEGLVDGMQALLDGKVPVMKIDYEKYNKTCIEEFENLLG